MKQRNQLLWILIFVALVWGMATTVHTSALAQESSDASFVLYVPIAVASIDNADGQAEATCPYLPDTLRYRYTPADAATGGFHRHSFLIDYTINDFSYMNMAAEYVVAEDSTLSNVVLDGVTAQDILPMGILSFGEYSQSPQIQNGVTYHWRVRLHCTDVEGNVQLGAWSEVQTIVAGE